jgi:SAM-dependent methyltransferase
VMPEYWEALFKSEGALWKFEPSDSALETLRMFQSLGIRKILIPGFGYGRNALHFLQNGFDLTGIEISESAIRLAREAGITCPVHLGSVTEMPFDQEVFDGIYCYALIHLLNQHARKVFLTNCFRQLVPGGWMIFVVASKKLSSYGTGKYLSRDRYQIKTGLPVYFYDDESCQREFEQFGLVSIRDILEPVKFMGDQEPLPMKYIVCRKDK